jgi:hypothetical protein
VCKPNTVMLENGAEQENRKCVCTEQSNRNEFVLLAKVQSMQRTETQLDARVERQILLHKIEVHRRSRSPVKQPQNAGKHAISSSKRPKAL